MPAKIRAVFKMLILLGLLFVVILLTAAYLKGRYNEDYWKRRGVAFYSKHKLWGAAWEFLSKDRAYFELIQEIYNEYPEEPAVGLGTVLNPSLFVTDPTNIHHVTTTDFNSFPHRGFEMIEEDLFANNVFLLSGTKWKIVRKSISPLFTSSKLKSMYHIIDKSAQDFIPYIKKNPQLMKGDAYKTLCTFCCAALSAAVFGITSKSVFDSPFLEMATKAFKATFYMNLKFVLSMLSPKAMKFFKIRFFPNYENFFIGAIRQAIEQRKRENVKKHDFIDICVSLQENGVLKDADNDLGIEPTDELLAAQAFMLYIAGVEPIAATLFNTLVLLGKHPEVFKCLQEEIDQAFESNGKLLKYDVITKMEYLDMAINESMRIYPAVGYMIRKCVKDTTLPVGNIKVDAGTNIFLPIFPLHHDSKYFTDPETFDPERFSSKNMTPISEKTFLPFGKGSRICIGTRYSLLQVKAGLVHLLRHFSVETIQNGEIKYCKDPVQVRLKNVGVEFIERRIKS